jgi:hypothetical protein
MKTSLKMIVMDRGGTERAERLILEIYFSLSVLTVLFLLKCLNCPCVFFSFVLSYLCLYANTRRTMTLKMTKRIASIGKRLVSVFLVLVVSLMLLTSGAVAATITTLNQRNFGTEVLQSDKPVAVILVSRVLLENGQANLEQLQAKAEKFFGSNYKIAVGVAEENGEAYSKTIVPLVFPPLSRVSIYKNGEFVAGGGAFFRNPNDPTQAFESAKSEFESSAS